MKDHNKVNDRRTTTANVTSHRFTTVGATVDWLRRRWQIWVIGLVAVGLLGTFLELAEDVWMQEAFPWDAPLMLAIHRLSRPWLDQLMILVTRIGSPGVYLLAPLTILWLWVRQRQRIEA
ncbi:MAG TPA: hypothetical protein P5121_33520, partial [Caldilineaceae bacterium]|nr:hypothetical protein [Caldilineaceae bacterium]